MLVEKLRRQQRTAKHYRPENHQGPEDYVPHKRPHTKTAFRKISFSEKTSSNPVISSAGAREASADRSPDRRGRKRIRLNSSNGRRTWMVSVNRSPPGSKRRSPSRTTQGDHIQNPSKEALLPGKKVQVLFSALTLTTEDQKLQFRKIC